MISAATIAGLESQGIRLRPWRARAFDRRGPQVPLSIPRRKGEMDLVTKEVALGGRRYVRCRESLGRCIASVPTGATRLLQRPQRNQDRHRNGTSSSAPPA
jgi:hypothetical protein